MNSYGKTRYTPLNVCRICGMDTGVRVIVNGNPEEFYIKCQICGIETKRCKSMNAATRLWNGPKEN